MSGFVLLIWSCIFVLVHSCVRSTVGFIQTKDVVELRLSGFCVVVFDGLLELFEAEIGPRESRFASGAMQIAVLRCDRKQVLWQLHPEHAQFVVEQYRGRQN